MSENDESTTHESLLHLGWKPFFEEQKPSEMSHAEPARVVGVSRQSFDLQTASDSFTVNLSAYANLAEPPIIGDWLWLDPSDKKPLGLLARSNTLQRRRSGRSPRPQQMLANFESVWLLVSANENFNESRLERGLVLAAQSGVEAAIVLTKADLCDNLAAYRRRLRAFKPYASIHEVDGRDSASCATLRELQTPGDTIALLGSSGVGKSTLINSLAGTHVQETQAIREQDSKGRHTTVKRALVQLATGAMAIDNPGVRELGVVDAVDAVRKIFVDIETLAQKCRFRDCRHQNEPGCAVRLAVEEGKLEQRRLDNYLKLLDEAQPLDS